MEDNSLSSLKKAVKVKCYVCPLIGVMLYLQIISSKHTIADSIYDKAFSVLA